MKASRASHVADQYEGKRSRIRKVPSREKICRKLPRIKIINFSKYLGKKVFAKIYACPYPSMRVFEAYVAH